MLGFRLYLSVAILLLALPAQAQVGPFSELLDLREDKKVSAKVAERIKLARNAIRFAKVAIPFAGNQEPHLRATEGRSMERMFETRRHPQPTLGGTAGVVACTRGGNCGENARMAAHFLGSKDIKHPFGVYTVQGFDHAFVLIGDPTTEPAHEVVVADPWVIEPEPVLWSDHFARKVQQKDPKKTLKKLNFRIERGAEARATRRRVRDLMKTRVDKKRWAKPKTWGKEGIWNHRSPFANNKRYRYVGPAKKRNPRKPKPARTPPARFR